MPEHLRKIIITTATGARHELSVPDETDYGRVREIAVEEAEAAKSALLPLVNDNTRRLDGLTENYTDVSGKVLALEEDVESLRFNLIEKPSLVARLVTIGYTEEQATEVVDSLARDEADAKVSLREGLSSIDYTVTEIEECMEDVPDLTEGDIAYAREIMEAWNPETTSLHRNGVTFEADDRLVVFPKVDFSKVKTIDYGAFCATNLAYIPLLDTSQVTSASAAFGESGAHGTPYPVKLRRVPAWDFSSLVSMNGGLTGLAPYLEYIPPLRFPKATKLANLFGHLTKLRVPPVEWTDRMTSLVQAFAYMIQGDRPIPFDGDMKSVENLSQLCAYAGDQTPEGVDFQGQTLRSKAPIVNLNRLFSGGNVKSLPKLEFNNVSDLESFLGWCNVTPKIIPDFSAWDGVKTFNSFLWPIQQAYTERVEGLNFASVDNAYAFGWGYNAGLASVRYIRIINLGKSNCTDYTLNTVRNWGANNEANPDALQSLIDTLITNSYDRVAAGMPAARVRLHSDVQARLTAEQKAAITAKGFTITT